MGKKRKSKKKDNFERQAAFAAAMAQAGGWPGNGIDFAALAGKGRRNGLLGKLMRARPSEQLLLGLLLGAGAAWVLSDEELRGKLIKGGMKLYASLAGGLEEMKEQVADIRAELEAGELGAD